MPATVKAASATRPAIKSGAYPRTITFGTPKRTPKISTKRAGKRMGRGA